MTGEWFLCYDKSMVLNISEISKSYDGQNILTDVSFHIEEHEKAALVGINGAGKSTLLKIIIGEISADSGQVVLSKDRSIGYLAQHQELTGAMTILDELLSVRQHIFDLADRIRQSEQLMGTLEGEALKKEMESYTRMSELFEREGGYACRSEVVGVLKGLGFSEEEFGKRISELSGGQKTRVALGKLLLTSPDVILLDEPTNHLDMHSIEWLETWLMNYRGAVLIVSHDRYFLNRIAEKVIEIERGSAHVYRGNYDDFSRKKEALRKAAYTAWLNAEQERRHQEEVITKLRQFNREKSIKRAESRVKMLEKMDMPEKPVELSASMKLSFSPSSASGKEVLTVEGLSKSFDGNELFRDVSFEVHRGEHVLIIGSNGTGKSTFMKILNDAVLPDSGSFRFGTGVTAAYYDQEIQVLDDSKTIFDEISDDYPSLTNTEIRTKLAAFLFTGEDVFKQISALSGGERARVSLCKLMLSDANLLLLDEPTNHLDIYSREILESAIRDYEGTVLCVSHDRYFINRTADRILDLTHGHFLNYIGNYDYYLEKKADVEAAYLPGEELSLQGNGWTEAKLDWKAQKDREAARRKKESDIARIEKNIEELEKEDRILDEKIEDPSISSDFGELSKLTKRKDEILASLEKLYEEWETLQES